MLCRIRKDTARISWKFACVLVTMSFIASSVVMPRMTMSYALSPEELPASNQMLKLTPAFAPPVLRGINVNPDDPLTIEFILDEGAQTLPEDQAKAEAEKLTRYFLAGLTIPETDLWVNLSVFEQDMVVPDALGATEMGRDLLAQDYILKQMLASLMHPDSESGKAFWSRVYARSNELFGTTDIPIDTFNKIWIVPESAVVYEQGTEAVVGESKLKVMLESDYLAMKKTLEQEQGASGASGQEKTERMNQEASAILKETIIPLVEKEVNEGKNFASLRQVYHSMILSAWYKQKLVDSIISRAYANKSKLTGINLSDPAVKQKIFQQYADAYKKGMYDLVKKEYDQKGKKDLPRRYFSGGFIATALFGTMDPAARASLRASIGPVMEGMVSSPIASPMRIEPLTAATRSSMGGAISTRVISARLSLNDISGASSPAIVNAVESVPALKKLVLQVPQIERVMSELPTAPVTMPSAIVSRIAPASRVIAAVETQTLKNAAQALAMPSMARVPVMLPAQSVTLFELPQGQKMPDLGIEYTMFEFTPGALSSLEMPVISTRVESSLLGGQAALMTNAAPMPLNQMLPALTVPDRTVFTQALTSEKIPLSAVETKLAMPVPAPLPSMTAEGLTKVGKIIATVQNVRKGIGEVMSAIPSPALGPIMTVKVQEIETALSAVTDRSTQLPPMQIARMVSDLGTALEAMSIAAIPAPQRVQIETMRTDLTSARDLLSGMGTKMPALTTTERIIAPVFAEGPVKIVTTMPDLAALTAAPATIEVAAVGSRSSIPVSIAMPKIQNFETMSLPQRQTAVIEGITTALSTTLSNIPKLSEVNIPKFEIISVQLALPEAVNLPAAELQSMQTGMESMAARLEMPAAPKVEAIQAAQLSEALRPAAVSKMEKVGGIDLNTAGLLELRGSGNRIVFNNVEFDLSQFAGFAVEIEMGKPQMPVVAATPAAMPKP